MKLTTLLFTLIYGAAFAAAPMQPITKQVGPDLVIKLAKNHQLQAVGWLGQGPMVINPATPEVTLKRQGWGGLPKELIFVPADPSKQAQIKPVEETIKKLDFSGQWQPLDKNKIAFWGQSPPAVCSLFVPLEESRSSVSFITFPKRKAVSRGGFFYLELDKQPGLFIHFSTNHALLNKVESPLLEESSDAQKMTCKRYYGGECDVVKSVPENAFGKTHHLKFPKLKKKNVPCPV